MISRDVIAKLSILRIVTLSRIRAKLRRFNLPKDATEATEQANSALLRQIPFSDNSASEGSGGGAKRQEHCDFVSSN
jgi:hypothetical protein